MGGLFILAFAYGLSQFITCFHIFYQDLQTFMDEAKDGVIYFTLGSLVRVSTMPKETLRAFRDAFAEIPQKVLWKFELEMEDAPPNVRVSKWFPQIDIFSKF